MKTTNQTPAASASRHTPEPWQWQACSDGSTPIIADYGDEGQARLRIAETFAIDTRANAARIVACVNAMTGLNPEAVAGVVAAVESALLEHVRTGHIVNVQSLRAALAALKGGGL